MLVEIFQTFRHKSFHKYSCIIMNRVSRFVSLVKPRAIVARTTKRSMHTFGKVHDMEPQDFRLLISSEKNNFPTTSDVIDNMLIENTIENIQIVDVRELNELEKLNFTDDFSRIVHLPLSTRYFGMSDCLTSLFLTDNFVISDNWSAKIARGDLLDSTKPTVCVVSRPAWQRIFRVCLHVNR